MLSIYPNQPSGHPNFYYYPGSRDPMKMALPGMKSHQPDINSENTARKLSDSSAGSAVVPEDPSKKVRKPYTITKSRESWTDEEHDKFIEALHLFDRDWKKIEAFVGSKTVIQIRSHAQKYFLKVQKSGIAEHVPPPRPKRKAAHPYPQKAPKNVGTTFLSPWAYSTLPTASASHRVKDEMDLGTPTVPHNYSCSSNESSHLSWPINAAKNSAQKEDNTPSTAVPDFEQVYSFLGSIFDPTASDLLHRLRQMDSINVETVVTLMNNLSVNLLSPECEYHRRVIASYCGCREEKENVMHRNIESHKFRCGPSNAKDLKV